MRAGVPLPFRDMHALQQLKALEGDPVVYAAKLREIYNWNSWIVTPLTPRPTLL
jgi:hypothetical protein